MPTDQHPPKEIQELLRSAGRRPWREAQTAETSKTSEARARMLPAVSAAWQEAVIDVGCRRTRRWRWAAVWFVALLTGTVWLARPTPEIGSVVAITADLRADGSTVAIGASIPAGTALATSRGYASLQLRSGHRIRLDVETNVHFESPRHLRLMAGAIYVEAAAAELEIHTAL